MWQSGVTWQVCAHLTQLYQRPFTAPKSPFTWCPCRSQFINQRMNEWKGNQWGKDDDWKNKQWNKWQPYDPQKVKGKGKGGRSNMVPKIFKHKDCVSVDHHGRRLCFWYNLKKCSQVSDGAQCHHGWHLCLRKGCHAALTMTSHQIPDNETKSLN